MRTEQIHGRWLLCGHILPTAQVKHAQVWAAADGSDRTVTVSAVRGDWVGYTWRENGRPKYHEKEAFAFQCRYCLVLPSSEIPQELLDLDAEDDGRCPTCGEDSGTSCGMPNCGLLSQEPNS